jgi:hypothetical protein
MPTTDNPNMMSFSRGTSNEMVCQSSAWYFNTTGRANLVPRSHGVITRGNTCNSPFSGIFLGHNPSGIAEALKWNLSDTQSEERHIVEPLGERRGEAGPSNFGGYPKLGDLS